MICGIDLGSTFFKAGIFDRDLRPCGHGAARVVYSPVGGKRIEMPVEETEDAFRQAVGDALRSAGCAPAGVKAVAIASQAQTFTVRSADGRARLPFISWRDRRSEDDNVAARSLQRFASHCSVDRCLSLLAVAKIAFLRKNEPAWRIEPNDTILMLPTWFVTQLTGAPAVDANLAAMSGLYSLPAGDWWEAALHVCGLSRDQLPAARPIGSVAGSTTGNAERFGLPRGIPVVLAGNDQTAGAYGAQIHRHDAVLISLGTAQVVYVCRATMPPAAGDTMRGPYPGGRFYRLAADECGTGTIDWARAVVAGGGADGDFDAAAAAGATDCHGVRFVADGPAGQGRWMGAERRDVTAGDRARAVLECLGERLARMAQRLDVDVASQPLWVTGGGSRAAFWIRLIEQRLGAPLHRVPSASPSLGAARMARKILP